MPTINGIKYSCEPCMRGHRSSKCAHTDRILVQVRKPGRPLSSCPHPQGQCTCYGLRVAIPKSSGCACGNDDALSHGSCAPPSVPPPAPSEHPPAPAPAGGAAKEKQGSMEPPPPASSHAPSANRAASHRVKKTTKRRASVISSTALKTLHDLPLSDLGLQEIGQKSAAASASQRETTTNDSENPVPPKPPLPRLQNVVELPLISGAAAACCQKGSSPTNRRHSFASLETLTAFERTGPASSIDAQINYCGQFDTTQSGGAGYDSDGHPKTWHVTGATQQQPAMTQASACGSDTGIGQPNTQESSFINPQSIASSPATISSDSFSTPRQQADFTSLSNCSNTVHSPPQAHNSPPPYNTFYTFPPTYTTFGHPLTPEELAFLQRNPSLFSRSSPMFVGSPPASSQMPVTTTTTSPSSPPSAPWAIAPANSGIVHNCNCGDACNCLGCIAHPYNPRTLHFVQSFQSLMADENMYDMSGQRRMSLQGVSVPDAAVSGLPAAATTNTTTATATATNTAPLWAKQTVVGVDNDGGYHHPLESWTHHASPHHNHPVSQQPPPPPPPSYVYHGGTDMSPPTSTSAPMYSSAADAAAAAAAAAATAADVSADPYPASPSAFFHVNYPADQCGIGSNDCVCGDSCACPGCTAHHGHSLSHSLNHSLSHGQGYGQTHGQTHGHSHDQSGARQLPDRSLAAGPALLSSVSSGVEAAATRPAHSLSSLLPSAGDNGGRGGNTAGCCANKGAHFGVHHTRVHHALHQ